MKKPLDVSFRGFLFIELPCLLIRLEVQVEAAPEVEDLTYSAPSEEGTPEITHEHVDHKKNDGGGHAPGSSFFKR